MNNATATAQPLVSVVIPTYNRKPSLLRTLDSLSCQTYPAACLEVIVVDDGGADGTETITETPYPFSLAFLRQRNQGDAAARNNGALQARGDILQFLDDDITVDPGFIEVVVKEHLGGDRRMVVGRLLPLRSDAPSVFEQVTGATHDAVEHTTSKPHFTEMLSGVLSLRKADYLTLGMMQPVAKSGSSVWCDVELAFRAQKLGFSLIRALEAIAYHDDYAMRDFGAACRRVQRAASVGADLLDKHRDLKQHIPMFQDKGPISWREDPPTLITRKIMRHMISAAPVMYLMERAVPFLEHHAPGSQVLRLFYRWIASGYIFRGYREGLRRLAQPPSDSVSVLT